MQTLIPWFLQALEKRLLTLEQETLQNNLLFEKFIRRLDEQFEITKNVDLTAIKVSSDLILAAEHPFFATPSLYVILCIFLVWLLSHF